MAKLDAETLERGRELLRRKDIDGFRAWLSGTRVVIDRDMVCGTYDKLVNADAVDRALRLFDETAPKWDPVADARRLCAVRALFIFAALGVLGALCGLAHLIQLVL